MDESIEWITRQEVARLMGVHPRTVDYHANKGHLTRHRDGLGRIRFNRAEVEAMITPVPVVPCADR